MRGHKLPQMFKVNWQMIPKSWIIENGNAFTMYCSTVTIMFKNTTILSESALCCDYYTE